MSNRLISAKVGTRKVVICLGAIVLAVALVIMSVLWISDVSATENQTYKSTPSWEKPMVMLAKASLPVAAEGKKEMVIKVSEEEIKHLIKAVKHEVGSNESYYPGYDLDYIQQCMTKVIVNRVGRKGFADSVYGVLTQQNQFMPLENLQSISIDERTRENVMKVLYGEDDIPSDLLFEMSYTSQNMEANISSMESMVGDVKLHHSAVTADNRVILFTRRG